jgi:hypothetical protein
LTWVQSSNPNASLGFVIIGGIRVELPGASGSGACKLPSGQPGTYSFLLLAWSENKEMQMSYPRKTITDLHKWMLPFMRFGITSLIDVGTLRDICADKRNGGTGLKLRPLKPSSSK